MLEFVRHPEGLAADALRALRLAALASEYVGSSPLLGTFAASRGFALTFTSEGREELVERFGFLSPFVERALHPRAYRGLWGMRERVVHALADMRPNAFFLNLLLVPPGTGVGPHVDATLQPRIRVDTTPRVVSVLYLQVPSGGEGGRLVLRRGGAVVGEIQPREGLFVHFRGDLTHEVTPLAGDAGDIRASLVCEQYCVAEALLERLPRFAVKSQGRFARWLMQTKGRVPDGEWEA
jgi:hypothetical protein